MWIRRLQRSPYFAQHKQLLSRQEASFGNPCPMVLLQLPHMKKIVWQLIYTGVQISTNELQSLTIPTNTTLKLFIANWNEKDFRHTLKQIGRFMCVLGEKERTFSLIRNFVRIFLKPPSLVTEWERKVQSIIPRCMPGAGLVAVYGRVRRLKRLTRFFVSLILLGSVTKTVSLLLPSLKELTIFDAEEQ